MQGKNRLILNKEEVSKAIEYYLNSVVFNFVIHLEEPLDASKS